MKDERGTRIIFGDFVDRVFWGLLVLVSSYGVTQIQALNVTVAKLNENMAIVVTQISFQDRELTEHRKRLLRLEEKSAGIPSDGK